MSIFDQLRKKVSSLKVVSYSPIKILCVMLGLIYGFCDGKIIVLYLHTIHTLMDRTFIKPFSTFTVKICMGQM